jgi:hypothetical protein
LRKITRAGGLSLSFSREGKGLKNAQSHFVTPSTQNECAECARLLARCEELAFEQARIDRILKLRLCEKRASLARLMRDEAVELTAKSRNTRRVIDRHLESAHGCSPVL